MDRTPTSVRRAAASSSTAVDRVTRFPPLGILALALLAFSRLLLGDEPAGEISYVLATAGAAAIGWLGVARLRAARRPFVWVCVGVTLSAVGDLISSGLFWATGERPEISVADVFWLSACVAIAIGLLDLLVVRGENRRVDPDALIDLGSYVVLSVIAVTQFASVGEIFDDSTRSFAAQVVDSAYPILDAAILVVAVRAVAGRRRRPGALPLALGLGAWMLSDFVYVFAADADSYSRVLDVGWIAGAGLLAASAWHRAPAEPSADTDDPERVGVRRVLLTLAPLLVPHAIQSWAQAHGSHSNPLALYLATIALIGLALFRALRLVAARDEQAGRLAVSQRYYRALAENSSDAVLVVDASNRIVNDAPRLAALLGKPEISAVGMDLFEFLDPIDPRRAGAALERARNSEGITEVEGHVRHADGSERWLLARTVDLTDDPAVGGLVINLQDITSRKMAEGELVHHVFHDALTGLANRALFRNRVEHALERNARTGNDVAIVYFDIDGFKAVNDSSGHEVGDAVLVEITKRLMTCVRTSDTVARLGGDEFAILVEATSRPVDEATTVADRILQSLTMPIVVEDQRIVLSASFGIAAGDALSTASSMLRDADVAMYQAKSLGKAKWIVYDPAMRAAIVERSELEHDIAGALAANQFRLQYQPIVELGSERVVGFEALLRWDHPTRGPVAPNVFIPIAEANGNIIEIGRWVLEEACRMGARWQALHPRETPLTMAVNVSSRQISTPLIVADVAQALDRSGLDPSSLVLELTETSLVEDALFAAGRLAELRRLGVRLAIDDFGTGYSSLSYLRQFPIDVLKIDRSFVNTITEPDELPAIVRGLLDLGKTLGLEMVAEGIEEPAQRDSLRTHGCELAQGYLFARPLSATDAEALLRPEPSPVG